MAVEHALVTAPLGYVEVGMEYRKVPLHMTIIGWLAINGVEDRAALGLALHQAFHPNRPVYQRAKAIERTLLGAHRDTAATLLGDVEYQPWAALHDVAAERDLFLQEDQWAHTFAPHIADLDASVPVTPGQTRAIGRGQAISFDQVAVFTKNPDDIQRIKRVEMVYPLRKA